MKKKRRDWIVRRIERQKKNRITNRAIEVGRERKN
jgi:hypothetical protein